MTNLEKKNHYNLLLSIYIEKLPEVGKKDMLDYYGNDLSLSEIAQNRNVSKNAVYLSIKQCEKELDKLEEKLHFAKFKLDLIKKLENLTKVESTNINTKINDLIKEIKNGI